MVYRFAAERLLAGLDLYSTGLTGKPGELLFIYPPFAAICALPLALLDSSVVHLLWLLGVVATLTYAVVRMLKSTGMQVGEGLFSLVALLVGVIAWLEPIRLTAELGQINLVLLALVVADLSPCASRGWASSLRGECPQGTKQGKWTGIGVGLAAGIKLTPALFIVYLLVTRRIRAALLATATFAATVGIGFAVAPTDSATYWLYGRFDDVNRISHDPLAQHQCARTCCCALNWRRRCHHRRDGRRGCCRLGRGVRVSTRAGRAGSRRCRNGLCCRVTVQLEPSLGVVRAVGRSSWTSRICPVGSRIAAAAMWLLCALVGGWIVVMAGDTRRRVFCRCGPAGTGTKSCLALMFSCSLRVLLARRSGSGACAATCA